MITKSMMNVRLLSANDVEKWDAYVAGHERGKHAHLSGWKKVIEDAFSHPCYYLIAEDSGSNICGILPLVQIKSFLFGNYMVSLPFLNYGGVLADSDGAIQALLMRAEQIAQECEAKSIEYRYGFSIHADENCRTDKVAMILNLPGTPDELGKMIGSKRRSQIKRPLRENPTVLSGGLELLDDFYEVFTRNMHDLGTPPYAKKWFSAILEVFPEDARLFVIYHKDEPVSCAFVIGFGDMMEIPWASTLKSVNHLSMNMLLYWEVLSSAINRGYKQFDFGRSSKNSGTLRFKKQWGGEQVQLYWYYWLKDNEPLPTLKPDNPKFSLAIKAWKKLPVSVTRLIGPAIVKNLP